MAAPEAIEEAGRTGANVARASERATEYTQKLCYMSINSCLPVRVHTLTGAMLLSAPAVRRQSCEAVSPQSWITRRFFKTDLTILRARKGGAGKSSREQAVCADR